MMLFNNRPIDNKEYSEDILNHGLTGFGNELSDEAFVQLGIDWYNGKDIQLRFSAQ